MNLVLIGKTGDATDSTELRYAERQLLKRLPSGVTVIRTEAQDLQVLLRAALEAVDVLGLDPSAQVLLARNPFLWTAPGTLDQLIEALTHGASAAFSYDSTNCYPGIHPDYLT
jgi:hypothetical protein